MNESEKKCDAKTWRYIDLVEALTVQMRSVYPTCQPVTQPVYSGGLTLSESSGYGTQFLNKRPPLTPREQQYYSTVAKNTGK